MSGRVTPAGGEAPKSVSSMRQRNPVMWWVAVIVVVGLVLSSFGTALLIFFA